MTWVAKKHSREKVRQDVRSKSARHGFDENLRGLYQLSFLLTRDHKMAERCFVIGVENFVKGNRAFNQCAHSWAKRIVIESAIRELKPRPLLGHSQSAATALPYLGRLSSTPSGHFDLDAILRLEHFERFVFVLSVLEHYSEPACARLLECSVLEIREGRTHALEALINSAPMTFSDGSFRIGDEAR